MSDVSQGPGWWLASDGRWYPPELAPGDPTGAGAAPQWWTPEQVPASSVSSPLAAAVRIVFWIVAGISLVRFFTTVAGWLTFNRWETSGNESAWDTWQAVSVAEGLWGVVVALSGLTLLVLVIVWSWQAHRSVTSLGATPRWRIGWTIGAWFACCAAVVIPKLVLNSIERGALAPRRDGRVRARWDLRQTLPIGWVWWIALIGSFVRFTYSYTSSGDARLDTIDNAGLITTSYWVTALNAVCAIVAAVAGGAYFARMSERLTPEGLAAHRDD